MKKMQMLGFTKRIAFIFGGFSFLMGGFGWVRFYVQVRVVSETSNSHQHSGSNQSAFHPSFQKKNLYIYLV